MNIYIYIYIYISPHTRVSSFPRLISVARVNKQRTTDVNKVLKAPGAELCQNACGVVNKHKIFYSHQCSTEYSMNKFRAYISMYIYIKLYIKHYIYKTFMSSTKMSTIYVYIYIYIKIETLILNELYCGFFQTFDDPVF